MDVINTEGGTLGLAAAILRSAYEDMAAPTDVAYVLCCQSCTALRARRAFILERQRYKRLGLDKVLVNPLVFARQIRPCRGRRFGSCAMRRRILRREVVSFLKSEWADFLLAALLGADCPSALDVFARRIRL